ncbi:glycogen debranching enzyme N-terminal domain-containing protein [Candidatus Mycobacterium methanotrophicum]|uniref:glycogen debranching enzyme N-terminal domain-containing protein n=1 Tax=Candidatus Mycobacterium methanotrophicum TaxID=2943498 RepID=UPI0035192807
MALVSGPAPAVGLGRTSCGELEVAERREWLVANGRGGYASGTVANMLTRRVSRPAGRCALAAVGAHRHAGEDGRDTHLPRIVLRLVRQPLE